MIQPLLFTDGTIPSPLCMYQPPCKRGGRAILGPPERISEDCEHRSITCLACEATGGQSRNLRRKVKA